MKIYVEDLAERIENQNTGYKTFLNKENGKFSLTKDEYIELVKNNEINNSNHMKWEEEYIENAKKIVENSKVYVELPIIYEIDELSVMKDFGYSLENDEEKAIILKAISEEGAVRRFKDTTENLGLVDKWNSFRKKVYYRIAIKLCEKEGINYCWLNRNNTSK